MEGHRCRNGTLVAQAINSSDWIQAFNRVDDEVKSNTVRREWVPRCVLQTSVYKRWFQLPSKRPAHSVGTVWLPYCDRWGKAEEKEVYFSIIIFITGRCFQLCLVQNRYGFRQWPNKHDIEGHSSSQLASKNRKYFHAPSDLGKFRVACKYPPLGTCI